MTICGCSFVGAVQFVPGHTHNYDTGVCTICGYQYPYESSLVTSAAGVYKVKAEISNSELRTKPYDGASSAICMGAGQEFTAVGKVTGPIGTSGGKEWYKTDSGYYVVCSDADYVRAPASTLSVSANSPISFYKGESGCHLQGSVSSNNNITYISGALDGAVYSEYNPNSTFVNLNLSPINKYLYGAKMSAGNHTLIVTAKDTTGTEKSATVQIIVKQYNVCGLPLISYADCDEGKMVTITQTTDGATLYYYYYKCEEDNGGNNYSTNQSSVTFPINKYAEITAFSSKSGFSKSGQAYTAYNVDQLATPSITAETNSKGALVTITDNSGAGAALWYSTDGTNFSRYYGAFQMTASGTVTAYAKRDGYKSSVRAQTSVTASAPNVPVVSLLNTNSAIAYGDSATVRWAADASADNYTARLYKDGKVINTVTTPATSAAFVLPDIGEYSITVQATNAIGNSAESTAVTVKTMPDMTVTFKDWDGSIFNQQTIRYGYSATKPSKIPQRRGYTFTGWDGNNLTNITSDITLTAGYNINYYTVRFYDFSGTLISSQSVAYKNSATEPVHPDSGTGYIFTGWAVTYAKEQDSECNWKDVDSDLSLKATKCWENNELPVVANITSAERNSTTGTYSVTVGLTNYDAGTTTALLRVVLKDSKGQMVKTGSIEFEMSAASNDTKTVTLKCSEIVSVAEAYVIGIDGNDKTGSALSKVTSSGITEVADAYGEWSDWSLSAATASETRQTESKTQYRSRDKQYTTSTNSSLDGWTQYKKEISYGGWTNVGWTSSKPTESDTLRITDTRTVTDSNAYNIYNYYHWYGYNSSGVLYNSYGNGVWKNYESTSSTYEFAYVKTVDGYNEYKETVSGMHGNLWFLDSVTNVPAATHTEWYYQTRTATNIYSFWRWGDYSAWTDNTIAGNSDREVQTQVLYRYRDKAVTSVTDSGVSAATPKSISGTLDVSEDLSGKLATVMVYNVKNTDPNESQIQYVGQTSIGSGNAYSFTFTPKNDPSIDSGDYIVALGIQGSTGLINVDVIAAPKEKYTVTFIDGLGKTISSQVVEEGGNAVTPDVPSLEGHQFVMWDNPSTNIHGNLVITAIYTPNSYAVAFVDYINDNISLQTYPYGEKLNLLPAPTAVGYTFNGWKVDDGNGWVDADNMTITNNTVIKADLQPNLYTVKFYDENNAVISTQTVAYGQRAELPAALNPSGRVFLGWNTGVKWWNVTSDLDVYPIIAYEKTAAMPSSNVGTEVYGNNTSVELASDEGAKIYYTTDGSEPTETSNEYTGPIDLNDSTLVRAISVEPGKNNSEVLDVYFEYSDENSYDDAPEQKNIGTYNVVVNPGDTIKLQVTLKNNPGIMSYLFMVECDKGVFYLDSSIGNGFDCTAGDVCKNGGMICSTYKDTGWQILWYNTEATNAGGTLFTITLKVSDSATPGTYPIKVSYSPANTLTQDAEETSETNVSDALPMFISDHSVLFGDVSGDGMISATDIVRIAKYIINDYSFTSQQMSVADVTEDGKINAADVIRLARYLVGLSELG